ncbi:MAG: NUDIX domain-containing protein [Fibrobacterales bacterium]
MMALDEQLRIYTESGKPTDQFKSRRDAHIGGDWHATVHVWIVNTKGELLFQKRSADAEIYPGLWDLSAAGHVVDSDTLTVSAVREVSEEIGLEITESDLTFLFAVQTSLRTPVLFEQVFQYVYLVEKEVVLESLSLQVEEVTEVTWRHYSILERLMNDSLDFVPRREEYQKLFDYLDKRYGIQ